MPGSDLLAQNFSLLQSDKQPGPQTIASANTISPVGNFTILTGNTVVKTISPVSPPTGVHVIAIQFAGIAGVDATGNILTAKASVAGEIMLLVWNPLTSKYIPVG